MTTVSVRYIVDDVQEALTFYRDRLGFEVVLHPAPGFAMLSRGGLRLLLNAPDAGGAGTVGREAGRPQPGGWNRFQMAVDDLDQEIARLEGLGTALHGAPVEGNGGRQALVADPSGNLVELFEPRAR